MTRSTIVRQFVGSLIGFAAGVLLFGLAAAAALSQDVLIMDGPDVVGVRGGAWSSTAVGLVTVSGLVVAAAGVALLVAWIGALIDTLNLVSKGWFVVELVLGLLGFVFVAVLAYVVAGVNGQQVHGSGPQRPGAPPTMPTSQDERHATLIGH